MANLTPSENPQLAKSLPALTTSSVGHPDSWNPIYQLLLDSVTYLGLDGEEKELALSAIRSRLDGVEASSSVAVEKAVKLDWEYRNRRIAHELFLPGYRLSSLPSISVIEGVAGDNSLDIEDATEVVAGGTYVLSDDEGSAFIEVTGVLSDNRITLTQNLEKNWGADAVITGSNFGARESEGVAVDENSKWASKQINLGDHDGDKAIVIRRCQSANDMHLYWRDSISKEWKEAVWVHRRSGGADSNIPAGMIDYEYPIRMRGAGSLKLEADGACIISHIVGIGEPTGLGGYVNSETRPDAPIIVSPVDGATNVSETPAISIDGYSSPIDSRQTALVVQYSTDDFSTVLYEEVVTGAVSTFSTPEKVLPEGKEKVKVKAKVIDDQGLESDWSEPIEFETMEHYSYVKTPIIVSPANGATGLGETFRINTDAYSIVGEGVEPNQVAIQAMIRESGKSWSEPTWDSGEVASNKSHIDVDAGHIKAGRTYYLQFRKEDDTLGWSSWSQEVRVTTKKVFANIIGVAMVEAGKNGGEWIHIDKDGDPIFATAADFDSHPVWGGMEGVLMDGQHMIKVPSFYFKHEMRTIVPFVDPVPCRWISDQPAEGFELYPAFYKNGQKISSYHLGKYQASMDGAKLSSKPGVKPTVSRSITQFIADAKARNVEGVDGFMLWSFYQWSAIQWLYLIENKTMDSQAKTGQGRVSASSAANVDASDVAQATYRGIVGLWGNVRQHMDGLKIGGGTIHMWDRKGYQRWVNTGKKRTAASGTIYPLTFMDSKGSINDDAYDFNDHFIGDTGSTSNSGATVPDYQWLSEDNEYFPSVGGSWGSAADAGLWCLNVHYSATSSSTPRGARLANA